MKNIVLALSLLNAFSAFSYEGKVVFLSGRATVLHPHHLQATELKAKENLFLDSSIITYDKSFVKISMDEGSVITIGPNSMIKIKQFINKKTEKPGIITLVKGQIGAVINDKTKINGFKSKFILTTRSSSMGVRGTEFMATFNEANGVSSLVTFKGAVAIAKSDNENDVDFSKLGKAFNDSGVSVKAGEFSGIAPRDLKVRQVEKVNSEQLALLEKTSLAKDEKLTQQMIAENKNILITSNDEKIIDLKTAQAFTPGSTVLVSHTGETSLVKKEIPSELAVIEKPKSEKKWLLGFGTGLASSSMDTANITQELTSRSISGSGEVHNSTRFAWRLYAGYNFTKNWSTELSYLDLGKSSTEFKNISQSDASKLTGLNSISGKGPQFTIRYKTFVTDELALGAKLGLFHWSTSYNDSSQLGASSNIDLNVYEVTYGYGAEFRAPAFITDKWHDTKLRIDYDHYNMKGNSTHLVTAGIAVPL